MSVNLERDARTRASNSVRLLDEVRSEFARGKSVHILKTINPVEHNMDVLGRSRHPMAIVSPDDGRECPTICFKQNQETPDFDRPEGFDPPAVWQTQTPARHSGPPSV